MLAIRGPELVPFMNMLKVVSNAHELGAVQVDVLLDRSAQLELDHKQLGVLEEHGCLVGPGELNKQADGTPAALQCPSCFLLIAPAKPGSFRDLLLLPDGIAYVLAATDDLAAARSRVLGGEEIVWESFTSSAVAAMVEESREDAT